jgi:outer membrane immunogenic protein
MKQLLLASVASFLAAGYATAADLYGPVKAVPSVYNWTGCYVGINGGGVAIRDQFAGTWSDGGLFGGQLGCNYQIDHFVFGFEGEVDWSGASSTQHSAGFFPGSPLTTITFKNEWDADVAVRIGLAFDHFLVYEKVGVFWGDHQVSTTISGPFGTAVSGSSTLPGFSFGLGVEYGLTPQLSAKVETNFVYFNATDINLTCSPIANCGGPAGVTSENSVAVVTKLGLNYRFW